MAAHLEIIESRADHGGVSWTARREQRNVGLLTARVLEPNTITLDAVSAESDSGEVVGRLLDALEGWAKARAYRTLLVAADRLRPPAVEHCRRRGFSELTDSAVARLQFDGIVLRHDLAGVVALREPDSSWPAQFERERARIAQALGASAVGIEHTGSTSVPGLAAKPILDITLTVVDASDEDAYLPALEAADYTFRLREPEWYEHRLFHGDWPRVNLHVFSGGCSEVLQMVGFRDWLRAHPDDRALYERAKRALATREWAIVQDYADAKTEVVTEIKRRAGLLPG